MSEPERTRNGRMRSFNLPVFFFFTCTRAGELNSSIPFREPANLTKKIAFSFCFSRYGVTSLMPLLFRARYLDSRALSKLGVYIPKPDLNTFFIRDEFDGNSDKWH